MPDIFSMDVRYLRLYHRPLWAIFRFVLHQRIQGARSDMASTWSNIFLRASSGAAMIRAVACGAVLIGTLAGAADARATTVMTYNFTQDGFKYVIPGGLGDGVLTGSFSGTPDSSGNFGLSNLTAFSLAFTIAGLGTTFTNNDLSHVTQFSYEPSHPDSFDLVDVEALGKICSGAFAAFGTCGGTGFLGTTGSPPFTTPNYSTVNAAAVTLTSVTSVTPIAPALPLFATSLAALGLAGWRRRRSSAA
jgi:hypothetical protein